MKTLRVIFAGNSDFSLENLSFLLKNKKIFSVVGILTKQSISSNRKKNIFTNQIKLLANDRSISFFESKDLTEKRSFQWIEDKKADIMIISSFGLIIPNDLLNKFLFGCINVHCSLLPKWRGPSPIQYAIMNNDKITGVSIIQVSPKIDSGDIIYQKVCIIKKNDTTKTLTERLKSISSIAILKAINLIFNKKRSFKKQDESLSSYTRKIKKIDAKINWMLPACEIERRTRAFNPWPVSFFVFKNKNIRIFESLVIKKSTSLSPGTIFSVTKDGLDIVTSKNVLRIVKLQFPGRKILYFKEFLNSNKKFFYSGEKLLF
ncbi:hypothetical protein AOQ88_01550 [Candidatus Riesia sp. GBBU]|nr:hypothetical protein AOQ88_01550 [Candidatus Riesia sp. GBBU]